MARRAPSPRPPASQRRPRQPKVPRASDPVLIVGGGIMGTSCAWHLARQGARVVVLEKSIPGAEASSAAAGILGAQLECSTPGPLFDLCQASMTQYPRWVRDLERETGVSVGFRASGGLQVTFAASEARARQRQLTWQGKRVEPLDRAGLRRLEPRLAPNLAGGVLLTGDGRVVPSLLYRATHIAAARAGVTFSSGAYVRQLLIEDGRTRGVILDDGRILRGSNVVVAAGSWTSLVGGLELGPNRVVPARGQIVELESPEPLLTRVVFGPRCYLVPRDDGRTLIGSTLEFVGYTKAVTAEGVRDLLDAALELVPDLAPASLTGTWSNFRPYTGDHLPLLGPGHVPGLVIASGHYRSGILLAPITAEIVSRLVLGKRTPLDLSPFAPDRAA